MGGRIDGSKVVVTSVILIVAALGVGTVYLPFIADKDKIRGMDEDGGLTSAKRREYERALKEMGATSPSQGTERQSGSTENENRSSMASGMRHSNSMWGRLNESAGKK